MSSTQESPLDSNQLPSLPQIAPKYDPKALQRPIKLGSNSGQVFSVGKAPEFLQQASPKPKDLSEVRQTIDLGSASPTHESPLAGGSTSSRVRHSSGGMLDMLKNRSRRKSSESGSSEASASASRSTGRSAKASSPKSGAKATQQATSPPRGNISDTSDEDTDESDIRSL